MQNLITRMERLQNSTRNLSWGHSVLSPMLADTPPSVREQYVVVCGHSHYHEVRTMLLDVCANGKFVLYADELVKDKFDMIIGYGTEDEVLSSLIDRLKFWFPAVLSKSGGAVRA